MRMRAIINLSVAAMLVEKRARGRITSQPQMNYYPFVSDNDNFYHTHNNNNNSPQHYHSQSSASPPSPVQNQESNTTNIKTAKEPLYKRILIVDDNTDTTFTYKTGLERYYDGYEGDSNDNKIRFKVYTYNNPLVALSEFKPHYYDLLLMDINMPDMNGLELCQKILELDVNVRVCFITAGEANIEALREVYPNVSLGCFIKKPVTIEYLVKRLSAELE
jgi:CheY-like chemotaxis protein